MTDSATAVTPFAMHLDALHALRLQASQAVNRPVELDFGTTDCGQHWAALGVDTLPEGSCGHPSTLVSILAGNGIPGVAVVMAADGSTVAVAKTPADFPAALRTALDAAVNEYEEMTAGAY